jgi:hypothetical protein
MCNSVIFLSFIAFSFPDGARGDPAGARWHGGGGLHNHRGLLRDAAALPARLAHEGGRRDAAAQLPPQARAHVPAQRARVPAHRHHGHPLGETGCFIVGAGLSLLEALLMLAKAGTLGNARFCCSIRFLFL